MNRLMQTGKQAAGNRMQGKEISEKCGIILLYLLLWVFLLTGLAGAETHVYVDKVNGINLPGIPGTKSAPFKSITYAMNIISSPDPWTIHIKAGVYDSDTVPTEVFPINLREGMTIIGEDGAENCIINGVSNSENPIFKGENVSNITIKNLTLQNMKRSSGNGGACELINCSGTIQGCVFKNNSANTKTGSGGGGIYLSNCSGRIQGCEFINNSVFASDIAYKSCGGGLYLSVAQGKTFFLSNNIFSGNSAESNGGGFYVKDSFDGDIINNQFQSNSASLGGGFYIGKDLIGNIKNNRFLPSNVINKDGFYVVNEIRGDITANHFGQHYGRTLCAKTIYGNVTENIFNSNKPSSVSESTFKVTNLYGDISNNIFINNSAYDTGGGCFFIQTMEGNIRYNSFIKNSAISRGGAFYLGNITGSIHGNLFSGNSAPKGSSFYIYAASADSNAKDLLIANNIFMNCSNNSIYSAKNITVLHNTFYGDNTDKTTDKTIVLLTRDAKDSVFKNNIFANQNTAIWESNPANIPIQNNVFYNIPNVLNFVEENKDCLDNIEYYLSVHMGYKPNNFNNNFNNNSNPYCNPSPVEPHFVGEDIESGVFPKATEAPEAPEYNPDTNLTAFADPSKKWVANQWAGALLDFGENMRFRIYGNDAEKIYVQGNLPVTGLFTENQDQAYTIDDLHLKADSPLIDAGVYAGFNLHDFEDDARPQSGGYDIGADEYARIIVTPSELTVSEPDGTATFTIRLKSEPASDVYIPVNSTFPAEAAASPFSVTLDKTNWNTGVTVTVTAEDDTILDGTQTCTIVTGSAVSADPLYNAYNPGDVTVNITDDEKPSLSIRYVLPNLGTVGQDMTVSVIGNGFDNTVTIAIKKEGGIETPVTQFTVSGLTKIDNMVIPAQSETGQYNLIIRRDGQEVELEGAVTFEESEIVEKQKKQKAIIVAGGGPYPGNVLWNATRTCTYKAYSSLLSQGYSDANIFYLTPEAFADINGDGVNDTDRIPTLANLKENLEYAIETWAADAEDLILYISDHGSEDELVLNKVSYQEEKLSVSQLDAMLDTLQAKIPGKVIFIYDACMSGSFLADMLPPDGEKRYVLTSTSEDEPAWFLDNGRYSFSYHFWHSVYLTGRLYISFETAKNMVSSDQTPRIDLNQDGSPDEITTDHLDNDILIGRGRVAASDLPIVVKESVHVLPNLLNCETSATIRADSVTAKYTVSTVWARITPPDFGSGSSFPVTELPREKLLKTGNGSYEGIYNQFLLPGSYKISVYAIDNNGDSSLFVEKLLTKKCEKGDINNDTETDLKDAIIALKILAGADVSGYFRTDYNTGVVDVNGNAKVEMAEAVFILQKVAGLR